MKKKSVMLLFLLLLLGTSVLKSQTRTSSVIDVIMKGYEPKTFTAIPVTKSEINLILNCGVKAPSARNRQLWKFTVVNDNTLIEEFIPNFTSGNVLIIISGQESPPEGANMDIDCAIATAYMYIAAQGLGLGGQIYTGPVSKVNSAFRQALAVPEGYKVISMLRVGNFDSSVDAVSAASTRKNINEIVNYR